MARPKKVNIEEDAKLADEIIAARAAEKTKADEETAPDVNLVDDLNEPDTGEETEELDGFDLSSLDEEPPPPPVDKDLAHKLSVLQGKYNAETERLSTLLSQTMTELQALKAKGSSSTAELADLSDDYATDIDKLKTELPSLYKSFLAVARVEAAKEVGKATKGTTEKVDQIVKQGVEEKKQAYYSRLTELLPSWEQINNHPSFLKWLDAPDEFSGISRREILGAAYNQNNHATTAKVFNAFIKEKGIRVKGKVDDSDGIAPDTSGATVNRSNKSGGTVTRAEIAKFFQDKAQRKLLGTEEEINKQEARFFQLVREGKVKY